jgi:hypothetical protein
VKFEAEPQFARPASAFLRLEQALSSFLGEFQSAIGAVPSIKRRLKPCFST